MRSHTTNKNPFRHRTLPRTLAYGVTVLFVLVVVSTPIRFAYAGIIDQHVNIAAAAALQAGQTLSSAAGGAFDRGQDALSDAVRAAGKVLSAAADTVKRWVSAANTDIIATLPAAATAPVPISIVPTNLANAPPAFPFASSTAPTPRLFSLPDSASELPNLAQNISASQEFITRDELMVKLAELSNALSRIIYGNLSATPSVPATGGVINQIALTNRIDKLNNVTITNATIDGLAGLTASDIPTDIVASNYLPLSGGTVTGATTLATTTINGALTVNGNTNITEGGQLTVGDKIIAPGEIGLGTSTPGAKLAIQNTDANQTALLIYGTTTQAAPLIEVYSSDNLSLLTVTASGRVGIGTSSPADTFGLNGAAYLANISVPSVTANRLYASGGILYWNGNTVATGAGFSASDPHTWTALQNFSAAASTTQLSALDTFYVGRAATTTIRGDGRASVLPYASSTALTISGNAYFPGSGIWNASGNVGIGTAIPSGKLDVVVPGGLTNIAFGGIQAGADTRVGVKRGSTNTRAVIDFYNRTETPAWSIGLPHAWYGDGVFGIYQNDNPFTSNARFAINATGVGIGTVSPQSTLSVQGDNNQRALNILTGLSGHDPLLPVRVASFGKLSSGFSVAYANFDMHKWEVSGVNARAQLNISLDHTDGNSSVTVMSLRSDGNVGIGTMNPIGPLHVVGTGDSPIPFIDRYANDGGAASLILRKARGSPSSPSAALAGDAIGAFFARGYHSGGAFPTLSNGAVSIVAEENFTASNQGVFVSFETTASGSTSRTEKVRITGAGNVGIGTTTPWRKLSVTGGVGFDGLTGATGAGSLCLSANREVVYNAASDACLPSLRHTKHNISSLSLDGLQIVDALDPVSFVYNEGDGRVRYGFIAEDAAGVDERLATYDAEGNLSGIDDRSVLAVVFKALKELIAAVRALAVTVAGFAENVTTGRLTTEQLCVEDVCVTRDQFLRMLDQSGQLPAPLPPPADGSPESEAAAEPVDSTATTTPAITYAPTIVPEDVAEEPTAEKTTEPTMETAQ